MEVLYKIPIWFVFYSPIIQLFLALTSILVSIYSYKLYKASKKRSIKLFSISFLLISISYIIWPLITILTLSKLNSTTSGILIDNIKLIGLISLHIHLLFFVAGLTTLVYMTLRKKDSKTYLLLLFLTLFPIIISLKKTNIAYTISAILIFFILIHYYKTYSRTKDKKLLPIFIAFVFLFLASLVFIFSDNSHLFYVEGHFLMFISYILILVRLGINYRKWQRKETK